MGLFELLFPPFLLRWTLWHVLSWSTVPLLSKVILVVGFWCVVVLGYTRMTIFVWQWLRRPRPSAHVQRIAGWGTDADRTANDAEHIEIAIEDDREAEDGERTHVRDHANAHITNWQMYCLNAVKAELVLALPRTAAQDKTIIHFLQRLHRERNVRVSDAARSIPYIVELCWIPTDVENDAALLQFTSAAQAQLSTAYRRRYIRPTLFGYLHGLMTGEPGLQRIPHKSE